MGDETEPTEPGDWRSPDSYAYTLRLSIENWAQEFRKRFAGTQRHHNSAERNSEDS